jgi:hypothetical protein
MTGATPRRSCCSPSVVTSLSWEPIPRPVANPCLYQAPHRHHRLRRLQPQHPHPVRRPLRSPHPRRAPPPRQSRLRRRTPHPNRRPPPSQLRPRNPHPSRRPRLIRRLSHPRARNPHPSHLRTLRPRRLAVHHRACRRRTADRHGWPTGKPLVRPSANGARYSVRRSATAVSSLKTGAPYNARVNLRGRSSLSYPRVVATLVYVPHP